MSSIRSAVFRNRFPEQLDIILVESLYFSGSVSFFKLYKDKNISVILKTMYRPQKIRQNYWKPEERFMKKTDTLANNLVLNYWNKLLLEKGIITRKEYLQMAEKILRKYPAA